MATLKRIAYGTVFCGCLLLAKAKKALLVIDMQVDFVSGSLAVGDAESIIENVNTLTALEWDLVVFTEDFHPPDHISFASNHPNKAAFEDIELSYTSLGQACGYMDKYGPSAANCTETGSRVSFTQTLWPDHCVQGTDGQKTDSRVKIPEGSLVIKKGLTLVIDSYGAFATNFEDNIGLANLSPLEQATFAENSLHSWLERTGIKEIYVVGLALDYCVKYTSLQGKDRGYTTYTVVDATRPVDSNAKESTVALLKERGVVVDMTTEKIKTSFEPTYTPTCVSAFVFIAMGALGATAITACCFFVMFQNARSRSGGNEKSQELTGNS